MEKQNLSRWQQGFLQKSLLFIISVLSVTAIVISAGLFSRFLYKRVLTLALNDKMINQEVYINLQAQIDKFDIGLLVICVTCMAVGLVFCVMRWIANSNWAFSTTLPEAIEFRQAMSNLGIKTPKKEIEFVQKYKLNVFIAHNPLNDFEENSVKARLYHFAQDKVFSYQKVFESYIGAKKLCILKEDYDNLLQESEKALSLRESSLVIEKDKEITALTSSIASLKVEIDNHQKELASLKEENKKLKNSKRAEKAQGVKKDKQLHKEMLQWAFLFPILDRLIEESPVNKKFTKEELLILFNKDWQRELVLQEEMKKVMGKNELDISEDFLAVVTRCLADKGLFSKIGGRPRKNPYTPKNL